MNTPAAEKCMDILTYVERVCGESHDNESRVRIGAWRLVRASMIHRMAVGFTRHTLRAHVCTHPGRPPPRVYKHVVCVSVSGVQVALRGWFCSLAAILHGALRTKYGVRSCCCGTYIRSIILRITYLLLLRYSLHKIHVMHV